MNTLFLGIIAFVLLAWWIRSLKKTTKKQSEISSQEIPTYEELVKMEDIEFKKWLFLFEEQIYRQSLLNEMIAYETVNKIIQKELEYSGKTPSSGTKLVHAVFNKDKSKEVVKILDNLGKETGKDLVLDALLAKVATDRVALKP